MIDWTLNVGTLVQILVISAGGLAFLFAIKGQVSLLGANLAGMKMDMNDVKEELKELRKVLQVQVDHDGRLTRAEADVRDLRAEVKELRHGEGFVFPLKPVGS
jgi:hypothetical protein